MRFEYNKKEKRNGRRNETLFDITLVGKTNKYCFKNKFLHIFT